MTTPRRETARFGGSSIRNQLIWAALFPLCAFGLLSILLITAAFQSMASKQALEQDTLLAQGAATQLAARLQQIVLPMQLAAQDIETTPHSPDFASLAAQLSSENAEVFQFDEKGALVRALPETAHWPGKALKDPEKTAILSPTSHILTTSSITQQNSGLPAVLISEPLVEQGKLSGALVVCLTQVGATWLTGINLPTGTDHQVFILDAAGSPIAQSPSAQTSQLTHFVIGDQASGSRLLAASSTGEQAIYSYAPLAGTSWEVILIEPWQTTSASAGYEGVLIFLLGLGVVLSLLMLSSSINRIIKPLGELSRQADALAPGSFFHPMKEEGPEEVRSLTHAFNQMVIRLAEQQAALRQYAEKILVSQEEERQRISHELHDETVQELIGLLQRVDLCRSEMDKDLGRARRRLDELKSLAETALNDLRRISNDLRPSILQDLGLPETLRSLCDELENQRPEVICEFSQIGEGRRLAPDLELAIFRVVQETLSNIRRHSSQVTQVSVQLEFESAGIRAVVRDNGVGFNLRKTHELIREGHFGVAGMYERARLFGGELSIHSDAATGNTITLWMPAEMGIVIQSTPG